MGWGCALSGRGLRRQIALERNIGQLPQCPSGPRERRPGHLGLALQGEAVRRGLGMVAGQVDGPSELGYERLLLLLLGACEHRGPSLQGGPWGCPRWLDGWQVDEAA